MSRDRRRDQPRKETYPSWVAALAGWICRIFFRRVEVVGRELVPTEGPVLFVANHTNGLVDPLLVMGFLPGRPRFLAKSTLWNNPVLRPFLRLGGVIPLFRRRDPGFDAERNSQVFQACRQVLASGGAIALFPEGQSHNEPSLTEIKTGAARILDVEDPAVRRTRIVPVGLHFDAKSRFRSRALVRVGLPLAVPARRSLDSSEATSRAAVRELTGAIGEALLSVTLNYESWDDARLVGKAAEIFLREGGDLPTSLSFERRVETIARGLAIQRQLRESEPERLRPLEEAIANYDARLRGLGLEDAQVAAAYAVPSVLETLGRSLAFLLFWMPLAAVGLALNAVPYAVCGRIASQFAREPDQPASYKLFGGIVLYPLTWVAEAVGVGLWLNWTWGAAVGGLALLGGWATVRFTERASTLLRESRAFLKLRLARTPLDERTLGSDPSPPAPPGGRALWRSLRRERASLRREFLQLVEGEPPD